DLAGRRGFRYCTDPKWSRISAVDRQGQESGRMTVGTSEALAQLTGEWTVFHDVPWPGQPDATIEHVAVGPGGVFVIDTPESSGRLQGRRDVPRRTERLRHPS